MSWLANMKVRTQLLGGFLLVAAIGALIGVQGILKAGEMNELASVMYERETVGLRHAAEANIQLLAATRAIRSGILAYTEEDRARHLKELDVRLGNVKAELDAAGKRFVSQEGQALVSETRAAFESYAKAVGETATMLRTEELDEKRNSTTQLATVVRPLADRADVLMTKLVERKKASADALNQETEEIYGDIRIVLISLTLGGVLVGVAIGAVISRSLTSQLGGEPREAAHVAARIAEGDLTVEVHTRVNDSTSMMFAMKNMRDSLARVVSQVRSGTDSVATATGQIAAGNQDLSSRTEQQASSLEETAASMEELTSTVKQNADNAQQANQLALTATSVAIKGGDAVSKVVNTMDAINDSSRKIADIIGVIDGIAFQTNILALNAAVEAARAGDQGRGFAVVASEVRALAQRSATAAKEIKALIDDSVSKVEQGTQQVSDAGKTMDEIVSSVRQVTDIMGEITAASKEQTAGIEQINQAVAQMDQVTQQNAALVEEAAAAADSLQSQADQLQRAVSVFRLAHSLQPVTAAPLPPIASHPHAAAGTQASARAPHRLAGTGQRQPAVVAALAGHGSAKDWESF